MSRGTEPTATGFAILGMLAIRPFTPYELTKQFPRSLGRFWPRARSKLYEGPKRLVELGYARASTERTGRRRRTVYSITAKGRRALRTWLAEPGEGPQLEYEQLMKVFFAEHGSTAAVLANLDAAIAWARARMQENVETGQAYLEGRGQFQQRAAQLVVMGKFMVGFSIFIHEWARWARGLVETWPEDPSEAVPDLETLEQLDRDLAEVLGR